MSKRNENRPGYKKTKVGWIPEEWECCKLSTLGNFTNGINKDKSEFGKGTPLVNLQDVFGRNAITDLPTGLVTCSEDEKNRYCLRSGDVLFVRSSVKPEGVGLTTVVLHNLHDCVYSGFLIRYRPKKNIFDTSFLKYIFYGPLFRKTVLRYSTISANTNINQVALSSIWLALPPLPEQKKIAESLSAWDRAIEQVGKLIDAKQRLKKGLMQQLLTGRMRFAEFGVSAKEEGKLPVGWKEIQLGKICKIRKGTQLNKSTLSQEGQYLVINGGIEPSGYSNKWNCLEDTITISEGGNSCGYVNFITQKFWSGGHCYTLEEEKQYNLYLYYFLKFSERKIMRLRVGSGLPNIQKKDIHNHPIIIPSIPEQIRIAAVLSTCDREIELLRRKETALREQKKGLMQKLLTGEVRVKI